MKPETVIVFTGDWCGWCIRLQKRVLKHQNLLLRQRKCCLVVGLSRRAHKQRLKQNEELQMALEFKGFKHYMALRPKRVKLILKALVM
jgi:protein disulfide-isomerase